MKRDTKDRSNMRNDCVCMVCKEPVNIFFPVRSNTWWEHMVGVRALLCSEECRIEYDERVTA